MVSRAEDFARLVQSHAVDVLVIPDSSDRETSITFSLPEELLTTHSRWFETKLSERWSSDDSDGKIEVVGFSVEAFEIFTHWLYRETIPSSHEESVHGGRSPVSYLLEAWMLFDYFNMPAQQNLVMSQMCLVTSQKIKKAMLIDEQDVLLAKGSGSAQLMRFALQALAISLLTDHLDWHMLPRLGSETQLVQEVWNVLVDLLKTHSSGLPCLYASDISDWHQGITDRLEVREQASG